MSKCNWAVEIIWVKKDEEANLVNLYSEITINITIDLAKKVLDVKSDNNSRSK